MTGINFEYIALSRRDQSRAVPDRMEFHNFIVVSGFY